MHQEVKYYFPSQKKIYMINDRCSVSIHNPAIYTPLTITTEATTLSLIYGLQVEKSFAFWGLDQDKHDLDLWDKNSPSWAQSRLHHINCSWNHRLTSQVLHLPLSKIRQICNFSITSDVVNILDDICISCPRLLMINKSETFILSMTFSSLSNLHLNSSIGIFHVPSVWTRFCQPHPILRHFTFDSLSNTNCAKLRVSYKLDPDFFMRGNSYSIEVRVAQLQYAAILFNYYFVTQAIMHNVSMLYKWRGTQTHLDFSKFEEYYSIFFSKKPTLSWKDASELCHSFRMVLPTFTTRTHVRQLLDFMQHKYAFQPVMLFTGVFHFVSLCF